ncbi:uncharacterized protein LOC116301482 [Actinia tenebrosa]|uniref:Uncharacterized protein LOC116301482 n=1 Tax=Actinia tenebrosa TaxID=6105 RepID=A0A6P8IIR7_ACTTE|nr:uncharacterized protein LOC116301482 [Actinia tenebrosa]
MEAYINDIDVEDVETISKKTPREFSSPWHFSDVVLVVEDTKFHVHKSTLSIWSPVFEAMFTSHFKERTAKEIPLPGKRADEVEQFLKVIYFDDTKQKVTETNYEFLLELAREYQVDKVQQYCGQYMKQCINDQNCLHRYNIADSFGLEDVMEKCNEEARFKSSTDLEKSADFLGLGFKSKFKLCMARMKELEKVLGNYVEICSELVSGYYEELSVKVRSDIMNFCDNQSSHSSDSSFNSSGGGVHHVKKDFDSSCMFCRKRIERCQSDIDAVSVIHFDDLFIKLYDLEHDDKVARIAENMKCSCSTSADHMFNSRKASTTEDAGLLKDSLDFSSPWHFSDVVLIVEDTKFHVHKSTLSMWSPVFEAMFTSQFRESNAKEIPLPGKRAEEVKELLHVIYSSWSKPKITDENYQFLLQLADEYQMDRVKRSCSKFLVNKIEVSNCLEFFKLAEQFGLDDVTEKCYQEVRYNSSADLEDSEHFVGFEPEVKVDICMRVIKELERTLREYVKTCSGLVQKVYKKVYESFHSSISFVSFIYRPLFSNSNTKSSSYSNTQQYKDPSEHIKVHEGLQNKFQTELAKAKISDGYSSLNPKDYNTKYFEFSCSLCLKQVQAIPWNNSKKYSILKEPLNKLNALQQNNKVVKMADKWKENFSNPFGFQSGFTFGKL